MATYLVERSNTGFINSKNIEVIGIFESEDVSNSNIGIILQEKEKFFQSDKAEIKFVDIEPVFHHNRLLRNGKPKHYELNFKISYGEDLIRFKNLHTLYRLTEINKL